MKPGTKVRTLYQFSETATVVRIRKGEGVPNSEWHIIRFDFDGRRACCHRDMLAVRNEQ